MTDQIKITATDCCKLNVTRAGEGDCTLVLVHGFGENSYAWGKLSKLFRTRCTVLAVDLRGHGDSEWDRAGVYHIDKLVTDVTTVMDRLGVGRFAIAGHSMGAGIALQIAARRKKQVTKLVLVEFTLEETPTDVKEFTRAQFRSQFRAYTSVAEYAALLQEQRPLADRGALLDYSKHSVRPREDGGYEMKCDPALESLFEVTDRVLDQRQKIAIARLVCPLLLIRGAGSAILTAVAAARIAKLSSRAKLSIVKGAGHAVMLDRPDDFTNVLSDFLIE
jgi:esterase